MSTALRQATLTRYVSNSEMNLKRGLLLFVQDLQRNGWWLVKQEKLGPRRANREEVTQFIDEFIKLHR